MSMSRRVEVGKVWEVNWGQGFKMRLGWMWGKGHTGPLRLGWRETGNSVFL